MPRKKQCYNKKHIVGRIFPMTFFMPLLIIFLDNLNGPNIKIAIHNSLRIFLEPESGLLVWSLVILLNISIYLFLRPIFLFTKKKMKNGESDQKLNRKSVSRFNNFAWFMLLVNTVGFVVGYTFDKIVLRDVHVEIAPMFDIFDAISIGLFTGTLMLFNTENKLFAVKEFVFQGNFEKKQRYSSFYRKILMTIGVILYFLVFQVISSFSSFYYLGLGGALGEIEHEFMQGAEFINMSLDNVELKDVFKVFTLKTILFVFYSFQLLRQIKLTLKNPLDTVQDKLILLNSNATEKSKQIDILNNDEFTAIYEEINKLIDKQNMDLQRSEEQLSQIVENAADPIISFLGDGTIHVFNPAAEKFFGYSKDEMYGSCMISLIDLPDNIEAECKSNNKVFIDYISNSEGSLKRFTGLTKQGTKNNFEANVNSSQTDEGVLYTAIMRDITSQIEFEEKLKQAKTSAENANKMKSEFLANMSHELRTPLNAVLGFTQLLSTDKNLTQGQLDKINTVSRSGEHLLGLINDILDISKIESGKTEMHENIFDLNQFIDDLKDMFILRCQTKGLSFYVEFDGEIPDYVEGDLGKLRQIMINLIGNAVKFTNEGGISLLVGTQNNKIRFAIKDTGKGIPAEEIKNILQPFMQSSNVDNEGGTGLGLAITNSFINMMGGTLEIESDLSEGSTFSFEIPLKISDKPPEEVKSEGTVIAIKDNRTVKALIVDDKVDNRIILKSMLENVGFVTMEAENGLEAIERTEEFKPEIIFMDIKMPVMDGYESVSKIKETDLGKQTIVFALTASAFKHDEKRIYNSGFDGFMAKPFKLDRLFSLVAEKTDVEFVYDNELKSEPDRIPDIDNLDFKTISENISEVELEKFADNILINDFRAVSEFADEISEKPDFKNLVIAIKYFANNFNEAKLDEILDKIRGQKNG